MTSPTASQIPSRIESLFGPPVVVWTSPTDVSVYGLGAACLPPHLVRPSGQRGTEIRRLWEERKGRQAYSVVVLAPAPNCG